MDVKVAEEVEKDAEKGWQFIRYFVCIVKTKYTQSIKKQEKYELDEENLDKF